MGRGRGGREDGDQYYTHRGVVDHTETRRTESGWRRRPHTALRGVDQDVVQLLLQTAHACDRQVEVPAFAVAVHAELVFPARKGGARQGWAMHTYTRCSGVHHGRERTSGSTVQHRHEQSPRVRNRGTQARKRPHATPQSGRSGSAPTSGASSPPSSMQIGKGCIHVPTAPPEVGITPHAIVALQHGTPARLQRFRRHLQRARSAQPWWQCSGGGRAGCRARQGGSSAQRSGTHAGPVGVWMLPLCCHCHCDCPAPAP